MVFNASLNSSIGVGLFDSAVRILSNTSAIWVQDVLLTRRVLNRLDAALLNPLDGAIREDALFFTVCKDALYRAVGETALNKGKEWMKFTIFKDFLRL